MWAAAVAASMVGEMTAIEHIDSEDRTVSAGDFSSWLTGLELAIAGEGESDVPCGDCTACCTASQFIHIEPDEAETLAAIPAALLFPAPGMGRGHVLLGYDQQGHCPMFVGGSCSIYDHRPRTCRTYDCRVFAATGVGLTGDSPVAVRSRRWRFTFPEPSDRDEFDAVRAAVAYLEECEEEVAEGEIPTNPPQRAVLAIELHETFLRDGDAAI